MNYKCDVTHVTMLQLMHESKLNSNVFSDYTVIKGTVHLNIAIGTQTLKALMAMHVHTAQQY